MIEASNKCLETNNSTFCPAKNTDETNSMKLLKRWKVHPHKKKCNLEKYVIWKFEQSWFDTLILCNKVTAQINCKTKSSS